MDMINVATTLPYCSCHSYRQDNTQRQNGALARGCQDKQNLEDRPRDAVRTGGRSSGKYSVVYCLDPDNTPSGELTNEEKMALATVLDAEMRKQLGDTTLGVDLKPEIKGMLKEISLKVAIKKIFPGLGHSDFEAKVKVKELLKDKRSVSFATTT